MMYELTTSNELDEFLSHYGVKGMKWGARRAAAVSRATERSKNPDRVGNRNKAEAQERTDRYRRVASGKGSVSDKISVGVSTAAKYSALGFALQGGSLKNVARSQLLRDQKLQKKITQGKSRINDKLLRAQGIDMRELNLSFES